MFSTIASCTLASSLLRQIALRQYVRDLLLETPKQWSGLYQMLSAQQDKHGNTECFTWIRFVYAAFWINIAHIFTEVRSLCASSTVLSAEPRRLLSLTRLHQLSVDFSREGLATQHPRIRLIFKQLESSTVGTNLSSLTLSSLPRIDVHLLRIISASFPSLADLYLSCTERLEVACCWICFEDSLSCTLHSPIPDHYLEIEDLTVRYVVHKPPFKILTAQLDRLWRCFEVTKKSDQPSSGNISLGWKFAVLAYWSCLPPRRWSVRTRELRSVFNLRKDNKKHSYARTDRKSYDCAKA